MANKSEVELASPYKRNREERYMKRARGLRLVGTVATLGFATLSSAIILPVHYESNQAEATTGTAISSTLTFTSTRSVASVNLTVGSINGTFATSGVDETAAFSISTDNYTGYTLLLTASSDTTTLSDGINTFASISSVTSASDFADTGATGRALNNKWGYIPSYYNSEANSTNYYSAPTSTNAATLMVTDGANGSASHSALEDEYTIGLGLRADYTNPSGTYTNATFLLQYTANPVAYVITYDGNGGNNTITNLPTPNPQYDDNNTATGVALSSAIPTSSNEAFSFAGWCTVQPASANSDSCVSSTDETGTIFQAGDTYGIDLTSDNTITLYALWSTPRCNANATTIATNTPATDAVCMQDMNDDVIASMTEETQYQLYDNRDWKTYFLAKMKDGKVWMTQNLDLDLETEPTNVATLTSENTNLTTAFAEDGITYLPGYTKDSNNVITWTPSAYAVTSTNPSDFKQTTDDDTNTSYNYLPQSFDYGEYYYYTTTTGANQSYNAKEACETAHNDGTCAHFHAGNYYSWTAAVAMNSTNSTTATYNAGTDSRYYNTNYFTAANSICPKGWRLPQGRTSTTTTNVGYYGDMNYLWFAQGIITNYVTGTTGTTGTGTYAAKGYTNISNSPLYMARTARKTNASSPGAMGSGYYWTSTVAGSTYSYSSYFQSNLLRPIYSSTQRYYEQQVRCVAAPTTNTGATVITFNDNSGGTATGTMSTQSISANTLGTLDSNQYTRSRYAFNSWCSVAVADGATCSGVTYPDAGTYYAAAGTATTNVTLYAKWDQVWVITYNGNGGVGDTYTQEILSGQSGYLKGNHFAKTVGADDYYFKGWTTTEGGTTVDYNAGQQITPTADMTLYAVWGKGTGTKLYDVVASLTKGLQLNTTDSRMGIKASTITMNGSGVYTYNAEVFGESSDAGNNSIYYYRGILDDDLDGTTNTYGSNGNSANYPNYVKLAGPNNTTTCWRIVRTTGSKGVKLIYNGLYGATTANSCANATNNAKYGTESAFYNSAVGVYQNIVNVGYTVNSSYSSSAATEQTYDTLFGTNANYADNSTNSGIKNAIEGTEANPNKFYTTYLNNYDTTKLEASAGYCNDRSLGAAGVTNWTTALDGSTLITPYGTSSMPVYYFGGYVRTWTTAQLPTLNCPRGTVDLYSVSGASTGNGQLAKPAALLTVDEAVFAGSGYSASNGSAYHANSFLRSGSGFWLLSPNRRNSNGNANGIPLDSSGRPYSNGVNSTYDVRPAISLTSTATISGGSGTATDPWEIEWPGV